MTDKNFQEKIGWKPHKGQKDVINNKERNIVICAGRRWGKSAVCGYVVARKFIQLWEELEAGKRDSIKIWIVAPTYDLARKVYTELIKFLLKVEPKVRKYMTDRPAPQIKISESVWIQCKSATEPQSLLGEELDLLVVDEAAVISKRIWFDYLIPTTMSKLRECQTFFISTPRGKNWFYDLWLQAKETNSAYHFTSLDGVSISQSEWNRIKAVSPTDLFQQNFEATFLEEASTVFRGIRDIVDPNCLKEPEPGHQYLMGVDLAQINDYTVFFIADRANNQIVYKDRFQKLSYPLQVKRILEVARKYNNAKIVLELNNVGVSIANTLQEEGARVEGFKTVGTISKDFEKKGSKQQVIEKLAVDIEHKNLRIPDWEVLLDELGSFGCEITPSGNIRYSAPEGYHDDCFVKGTLIKTLLGDKPIEDIKIGDLVLTRDGYKPVIYTRKKPKRVISNIGLTGTPNHPIILADGTLKKLQDICSDDILHIWNKKTKKIEKQSFIMAKNIIATQTQKDGRCVPTFRNTTSGNHLLSRCIDKFGKIILEKSKKVISYITKIIINLIMKLPIWRVLMDGNIINITQEKKLLPRVQFANTNIVKNILPIQIQSEKQGFVPTCVGEDIEMVYNLQVLGKNEYFANNILVHNCVMALAITNWGLKSKPKLEKIKGRKAIPPKKKRFQYE